MTSIGPVNPRASREARELLEFLYSVRGRYLLSGQHNQMHHMSVPSDRVREVTGVCPLIWGGEWGFSDERHNIDNIKFRPKLLDEIRARHAEGRIIVVTYHQASPTVAEPCDFVGGVILSLYEQEWDEILTTGSRLNLVWADHVDRLAGALKTLRDEGIPVIFRPYHEMNGDWFWWGGDASVFKRLWAMIFDRFVNHHDLTNLLWAWNPDKPLPGVEDFFPGHEAVDLVGTDIYPREGQSEVYPQEWYDLMAAIAGDKPLALSENSRLPDPTDFARQPWLYFMTWDNMLFHANEPEFIKQVYSSPTTLSTRPKK